MTSSEKCYRVLHIFSSYGGGISSLVLNLTENKSEDFVFDTMAFSYKNGEEFSERIRNAGGKVYQMPRPRIDGYMNFKKYIDNVISENRYDAIHCHITGCHAIPFVNSAKKHGIKNFIFHAHTTRYDSRIDRIPSVQLFNKFFNYNFSSVFMACSDLASDYIFGKRYLNKRSAYIIPNGIKEELFSDVLSENQKATYCREFGIPDDAFVIGHIGRFSYPKNHMFLLEIAKKLKEKNLNFVLVSAGDGELFDSVKEKAEADGLSENIRFLGRRTDISNLMQFFDCMLLPSVHEGLPTVAVECQAAGTQMIISDTVTKQCDLKLGLLEFLPLGDATLWADTVDKVLLNGHTQKSGCLTQVRQMGFTAKESGKQYCNILKKVIETRLDN